jgi:hypothetical protein
MTDEGPSEEPLGKYERGALELVDAIVARLDEKLTSGKTPPGEIAAAFGERCGLASLRPLLKSLRLLEPGQAEISAALVWQLIGAAYGAGQLTPHAKIVRRLGADQAARGGRNSAATRSKNAEIWQVQALKLAGRSRERDPCRMQDGVVEDVTAWWELTEPKAPGHSILKPFISRAEHDGRLPRRQPKKNRQNLGQ